MNDKRRHSMTSQTSRPPTEELSRKINFWPLFSIVVANMIGVGIFTTSGFVIRDVGHPWLMLIGWSISGLFALCGAFCYAELGAAFPCAGGDYVFLREAFDRKTAFLSGWISLIVGFSAPIAAAAAAFWTYFAQACRLELPPGIIQGLSIVLIALMTRLHIGGLTFGAKLQTSLTLLKILIIATLTAAGLLWGAGTFSHFTGPVPWSRITTSEFASSLIFISFAYSGWNAPAYIAGEIRDPSRSLPAAIMLGCFFVIGAYLMLNLVFVYAVPPDLMAGKVEVGSLAATGLFGDKAAAYYGLAIALSLLSSISAMVFTGPRIYYAMAKDKTFFDYFSAINPKTRTPSRAIILQGAAAAIFALLFNLETLMMYVGFMLSIFSTLTVLGLLRLRAKGRLPRRPLCSLRYSGAPFVFIASNVWIVGFTICRNPHTLLWGGLTAAIGLVVHYHFTRQCRKAA